MSKLMKRLIPILILGMAILTFVYLKNTKPEQTPVEVKEKVWMVHSMPVVLEALAATQTLYGVVESNAMVRAAAPVSAVVEAVNVLPGNKVSQGDLLVKLSPEDLRLPVEQASADVADAIAQMDLQKLAIEANKKRLIHEKKVLELKQESVERAKTLMKKNLASQSALDAAKEALVKQEYAVVGVQLAVAETDAKLAQLEARLKRARAALSQAELNQERGVLLAPFDGRVASVEVAGGDRVNPGTVLVSYYGFNSLELKAKLPMNSLREAQRALSSNQSLTADYSEGGESITLPLLRLAGEASTSGVDAYFSIPEALHDKRPGELLEVHFKGQSMQEVVALPYSAIYGNNRIYLIEEGRLRSQSVELRGEVIREGKLMALVQADGELEQGMKVLTTHLPNAINGLKVSEVE